MTGQPIKCQACDSEAPEGAAYCPACGSALSVGTQTNPLRPAAPRPPGGGTLATAEPRIFGMVPPLAALVAGVAGVVGGAVLILALGIPLVGLGLVLIGIALTGFAVEAARRWPGSTVARFFVGGLNAIGSRLGVARVSAGAWSQAARARTQLRRTLHGLRGERTEAVTSLGEATYRQDEKQVAVLRNRVRELDERLSDIEAAMEKAFAEARSRVERKRAAVQPTEAIAIPEEPPADDRAGTEPTAIRRRAEGDEPRQ